jgi:hypothetical protein
MCVLQSPQPRGKDCMGTSNQIIKSASRNIVTCSKVLINCANWISFTTHGTLTGATIAKNWSNYLWWSNTNDNLPSTMQICRHIAMHDLRSANLENWHSIKWLLPHFTVSMIRMYIAIVWSWLVKTHKRRKPISVPIKFVVYEIIVDLIVSIEMRQRHRKVLENLFFSQLIVKHFITEEYTWKQINYCLKEKWWHVVHAVDGDDHRTNDCKIVFTWSSINQNVTVIKISAKQLRRKLWIWMTTASFPSLDPLSITSS